MSGYSDETRELAYQRWQARAPLAQISDELGGVSVRTLELWRSSGGWVARRAHERATMIQATRDAAEDRLTTQADVLMAKALGITLGPANDPTEKRLQVDMLKYLIGVLGWSPQSAGDRLRAIATQLEVDQGSGGGDDGAGGAAAAASRINALLGFDTESDVPPTLYEPAGAGH